MDETSRDPTDEESAAFLAELSELSNRHRIVIFGCGCCGSPSLMGMADADVGGRYHHDGKGGPDIEFRRPD